MRGGRYRSRRIEGERRVTPVRSQPNNGSGPPECNSHSWVSDLTPSTFDRAGTSLFTERGRSDVRLGHRRRCVSDPAKNAPRTLQLFALCATDDHEAGQDDGGRTRARTWDPLIKSSKPAPLYDSKSAPHYDNVQEGLLFIETCRIASRPSEPRPSNTWARQTRLKTVLAVHVRPHDRHSHCSQRQGHRPATES
jgi:hypothetical protein